MAVAVAVCGVSVPAICLGCQPRPPKMLSQNAFFRKKKEGLGHASALKMCTCIAVTHTESQLMLAFTFLQQMVGSPT